MSSSATAPSPSAPLAAGVAGTSATGAHKASKGETGYAIPASDYETSKVRREEIDALDDEIARLSSHIEAAAYRLLVKIREFDRCQGWHDRGFRSCAAWLSWRTHITPGTARERVRVARALENLPLISQAMKEGRLSYSCVRALTRVAEPENEERLLTVALVSPASDLERLVRRWRTAERSFEELRAAEEERHGRRELWLCPEGDGSYRLHGRLDPEVGAALRKALDAAADELYTSREGHEETAPRDPRRVRWADALGLVAEAALGDGLGEEGSVVGRAEQFQVVVHVTEEVLEGKEPVVGDPVRQMERKHRGLGIGPESITPDWDGLHMDVDFALEALGQPSGSPLNMRTSRGNDAVDVPAETRRLKDPASIVSDRWDSFPRPPP